MRSLSDGFQKYEMRSLLFRTKAERIACKDGTLWQTPISRK